MSEISKKMIKDSYADCITNKYQFMYALKDEQIQALYTVLNKKHCLSVLPTGYGKSDIFVLAPLLLDCLDKQKKHHSLVIVPLESLMLDMVCKFRDRSVSIVAIRQRKKMTKEEIMGIKNGQFSVILVSPECLEEVVEWRDVIIGSDIYQQNTCLIAIDEAHLLIQW